MAVLPSRMHENQGKPLLQEQLSELSAGNVFLEQYLPDLVPPLRVKTF